MGRYKFVSKCCNSKMKIVYGEEGSERDYWQCLLCKKETSPLPTKNGFIPNIWPKYKKLSKQYY